MRLDPGLVVIRRQSGRKKARKQRKNCLNCLEGYTDPQLRQSNFRSDFVSCARWRIAVHVTHAKICPYYSPHRSPVRKGKKKWWSFV